MKTYEATIYDTDDGTSETRIINALDYTKAYVAITYIISIKKVISELKEI